MRRGVFIASCLVACLAVSASPASAGPLRTAIVDPVHFGGVNRDVAFARSKAVGASLVRLNVTWAEVAPEVRPDGWVPTDPASPGYNWTRVDQQVTSAVAAGLQPILSIAYAPVWAEGTGRGAPGTRNPDPVEFGMFARAAAKRYNGNFSPNPGYAENLPVVRYWQAWNEPNRDYFFLPQFENGRMVSADLYRVMVNRFANALHAENPANKVIAGGLAPLGRAGKPAPLTFMRDLLSQPVQFDIWAHHPYTSGGPTHAAAGRNDVSLGDLPEMRAVLRAGIRSGRVASSRSVEFWVTEFSWDSSPPDPAALRSSIHARWVSEALYRMWRNGITVVTWYRIQDDPLSVSPYQSGFYRTNGARKASFTAFRFPVVAFTKRRGIYVWGRTPTSQTARVIVELKSGRRWRRIGTLKANSAGLFSKTYRTPVRRGHVRARVAGASSLPFSLTPVRDRYVNPFGCGGPIRC